MQYEPDIDHELRFTDEPRREPVRIRNATLIAGHVVADPHDDVTAYAHAMTKGRMMLGAEFGQSGGAAAKTYAKTITKRLHHEQQYSPVIVIYPDDI